MDPISTARYGMMAASQQLATSATRIAASPDLSGVDYASEAVSQIAAKHAFNANIGVIKVADEMWRALLDLQAR